MKRILVSILFVFLSLPMVFANGTRETVSSDKAIIVFAAVSTIDVIQDLADLFKAETGQPVLLNPASSGTLAKQLIEGAYADVYVSASARWMDYVTSYDLVEKSAPFAGNRIVLIAPSDSTDGPVNIDDSLDFPASFDGRLSMGDPSHVPAGAYALSGLEYYQWYDEMEPRLLPGANVRVSLAVVELGETERGIVYRTDALKSKKVKILGVFPEKSHRPVSYFCAFLKQGSPGGKDFYDYISTSEDAAEVLRQYGFEVQ
jgi:molybdate transport system substrate-binding protein